MITAREARVEAFVLHHLGERTVLSDFSAALEGDEEQAFLCRLFLKPFSQASSTSEFAHPVDPKYNVLHGIAAGMRNAADIVPASVAIARHLEAVSQHHRIGPSDLFVVQLSGVEFQGGLHDAVGVYKFDAKEVFLESEVKGERIGMRLKRGLGQGKPTKACLILFTQEEPTLLIVDDQGSTDYWQNDFICHRPKRDHVNSTRGMLEMTRSFITEQLPADYDIGKADQIDLLNRSVSYFKEHTSFDREEFAQEVFQEEAVIKSFERFGDDFRQQRDVHFDDSFAIAPQAVKRQARIFKSVIKLDRNFHIYIHGDRSRIEQGVDEQGRKYYRIYYDQEL
jgi:hypothetical protein